jgi:clan AA aspartic protease (TIGR02281 family)
MRSWLIVGAVFVGSVLGWLARGYLDDGSTDASKAAAGPPIIRDVSPAVVSREDFLHAIEAEPPARRREQIEAYAATNGHNFQTLMLLAAANAELGGLDEAIRLLLDAAIEAASPDQQATLEAALAMLTRDQARQLVAANRFDEVDEMYERVTLALPELSDYFMELGELRLRLGNVQGAMTVLAQIQNHSQLGARARELMAQAEAAEAIESSAAEELPLRIAGTQFVVEASLDGGHPVALLIDTGAAMTVIRAETLARMGYSMSERQELFATAGGVVEAPVVMLDSLTLGNSTIHQLPVGALALEMHGQIDGLLGMNFLRHFEFRIDQDEKLLFLDSAH